MFININVYDTFPNYWVHPPKYSKNSNEKWKKKKISPMFNEIAVWEAGLASSGKVPAKQFGRNCSLPPWRLNSKHENMPQTYVIIITIIMACRHIPTMTKSHHGGNMSVMIKVGMCQCQNPTIHDKVQLGPVGSGKLFNSAPVLRRNISAHFVNLTEPSNVYWK